ncbi:MAG TPA: hypothetical protein EYQ73_03080 [Candidatus Poseidoniales archaeon]|jgi:hypothetical protein|nr:MAG: hypothetical protein CXT71_00475 [Euryarchaeota archaeon]HIF45764.1 hypothetical protein [Candidatus Poseidoniales archaeon]HIL65804.1 hypothetical protein [Candidatus Poseidoniales archaeon]
MRVLMVVILLAAIITPASASLASDNMIIGSEYSENLNGTGVIISVADTGIDLDHSCFRDSINQTGTPGVNHRKVVLINDTIDNWDNSGQQQFRHGTHIAGILGCDPLEGEGGMASLSSGARLVVQDIVGDSGWTPPAVDKLLSEAGAAGAVIHSWSWGDNTVDYTNRSANIDTWTMENPWSLIFIAPGNNGGRLLEPANARNVVAVAASDGNSSLWPSSSHGPDADGRRGILISAPGVDVVSAKGDGIVDSFNNESLAMTGTSMATPMAASFTALLQQKIQDEYGFVPSAALLRAMLALSADPLTGASPDQLQGYGLPNISNVEDIWIHDSFQTENHTSIIDARGDSNFELLENPWNGSGSEGPFLEQGDSYKIKFKQINGSDVTITMSYNSRPQPYEIDDLRLIAHTSDGKYAIDDDLTSSGFSPLYYPSFMDSKDKNSSNETTVMIRIPASQLNDSEWVEIEVFAKRIHNGSVPGTVGVNGNRLGFSLSATGLDSNPWVWQDEDSDGVSNEIDECDNTYFGAPVNDSGCVIHNTAPILFVGDLKENYSDYFSINWSIFDFENDSVVVMIGLNNSNYSIVLDNCTIYVIENNSNQCVVKIPDDLILYQFNRHDWRVEFLWVDNNESAWTNYTLSNYQSDNFTLWWDNPALENKSIPPQNNTITKSSDNRALFWGIFGIVAGVLFMTSITFRALERKVFQDVPDPFLEQE